MKTNILIILFIIGAILCAGCINSDSKEKKKEFIRDIVHYEVYLNTTENINYTIYLPIPYKQNNYNTWISSIVNNLSVIGKADYEIINTTYGIALKINGKGSIHLYNHFESDTEERMDYNFNELTMKSNKSNNDPEIVFYYIYSDYKGNDLKLVFHTFSRHEVSGDTYGYTNYEWELNNYLLKNNWQEVNLYKEWIILG